MTIEEDYVNKIPIDQNVGSHPKDSKGQDVDDKKTPKRIVIEYEVKKGLTVRQNEGHSKESK